MLTTVRRRRERLLPPLVARASPSRHRAPGHQTRAHAGRVATRYHKPRAKGEEQKDEPSGDGKASTRRRRHARLEGLHCRIGRTEFFTACGRRCEQQRGVATRYSQTPQLLQESIELLDGLREDEGDHEDDIHIHTTIPEDELLTTV